jgi:hypothetical protein
VQQCLSFFLTLSYGFSGVIQSSLYQRIHFACSLVSAPLIFVMMTPPRADKAHESLSFSMFKES